MKKLFVVLGLVLVASMLLVGCGKTDNSSQTLPAALSQDNNRTGTLQGKIMDAVTGAPVGNDAKGILDIWLIQGSQNRGADKLDRDMNSPLCGEYAFSGIPIDLYTGNATFKVVVVKAGYQRFEANVELTSNTTPTLINNTFDAVINMIGNIYLFPEGLQAGDVNIIVRDPSGIPIPGANVRVWQDVENNSAEAWSDVTHNIVNSQIGLNPNNDRLKPTGGLYTSITATTDAGGMTTISGTKLVLGGAYVVRVAEMVFNSQILGWGDESWTESTANPNVIVNMTVHSGTTALFATSASNQVPGTITANGVLTVTFNQPIALTTTGFWAEGLDSNNTYTPGLVQAVLSNNDMTMTLTPRSYMTGTTVNRAGSTVTFTPSNATGTAGAPDAQIFILKNSQTAVNTTFDGATNKLQNSTTGAAVSKVVRQLQMDN